MAVNEQSLYERLSAPFPYCAYEYDEDKERVYVSGQAVADRLNEVLGVGFWRYEPIEGSIEVEETGRQNKYNEEIKAVTLLVNFQFYNSELKQWISFVDAGSQDLNKRMGKGDAIKSAITDGMKKCASRIGVASDVYKGKIKAYKGRVILPENYRAYYEEKGWKGIFAGDLKNNKPSNKPTEQPDKKESPQKNSSKPAQNKPTQSNSIKVPTSWKNFWLQMKDWNLDKDKVHELAGAFVKREVKSLKDLSKEEYHDFFKALYSMVVEGKKFAARKAS